MGWLWSLGNVNISYGSDSCKMQWLPHRSLRCEYVAGAAFCVRSLQRTTDFAHQSPELSCSALLKQRSFDASTALMAGCFYQPRLAAYHRLPWPAARTRPDDCVYDIGTGARCAGATYASLS